ncbi:Uncharacterised protein [uncultured archaeon]|nr:Uncharacterised protein [uncultured archaeon]
MTHQTLDNYVEIDSDKEFKEFKEKNKGFWGKCADAYFKPRKFEKRLYELLGIKTFQKAFMATFGEYRKRHFYNGPDHYQMGKEISKENLERFIEKTKENESIHSPGSIGAVVGLGIALPLSTGSYLAMGLAVASSSIILAINLPVTILQRYNRARIQEVLDKRYGGNK